MGVLDAIFLLLVLQFKHFLADFVFQTRDMVRNKGIYGHKDGLAHAGTHGAFTLVALALAWQVSGFVVLIAVVETVVHYHVDWAKEQATKGKSWTPDDTEFWIAIGFDQFLHQLTYIALIFWIFHVV